MSTFPTRDYDLFKTANHVFSIEYQNLVDKAEVNKLTFAPGKYATLLPQMQALQRLIRVILGSRIGLTAAEAETAGIALINTGKFGSALDIAAVPKSTFVNAHKSIFSGNAAKTGKVHEQALKRRSMIMLHYMEARDRKSAAYKSWRVHQKADVSYENLFGPEAYDEVESGRDILSANAYLTDLKRTIAHEIDTSAVAPHYTFDARRPDLDSLVLNEENTVTEIPKLEIVNDVLQKQISPSSPFDFATLASTKHPIKAQYHQALDQIRTPLKTRGSGLAEIYKIFGARQADIVQETLGLSPEVYTRVTTANTSENSLRERYGIKNTVSSVPTNGALNIIDFNAADGTDALTDNNSNIIRATQGDNVYIRPSASFVSRSPVSPTYSKDKKAARLDLSAQIGFINTVAPRNNNDFTILFIARSDGGLNMEFRRVGGNRDASNLILGSTVTGRKSTLQFKIQNNMGPEHDLLTADEKQLSQALLDNDDWHLLVFTKTGENYRSYIDGRQISSRVLPRSDGALGSIASATLHINKATDLDFIALYDRGLSRDEIFNLPGGNSVLGTLEHISAFKAATSLSQADFEHLVYGGLTPDERTLGNRARLLLNKYRSPASLDVSSDKLSFTGLSLDHLDRMDRILRLHQATGISLPDLYYLLEVGNGGRDKAVHEIDDTVLHTLALYKILNKAYNMSADEAGALLGDLNDLGKDTAGKTFYDRIYDPAVFAANSIFANDGVWYPIPGSAITDAQVKAGRELSALLAGALGVSPTEIKDLAVLISKSEGIKNGSVNFDRGVLSILYRIVRLSRTLLVSVDAIIELLRLGPSGTLTNLANNNFSGYIGKRNAALEFLLDAALWLKTSGLSFKDLQALLETPAKPIADVTNFLNDLYQAIKPTLVTEAAISATLGTDVTLDVHRALVAASVIEQNGMVWQPDTNLGSVAALASLTSAQKAALARKLKDAAALQVKIFETHLANSFAVPAETATGFLDWISMIYRKQLKRSTVTQRHRMELLLKLLGSHFFDQIDIEGIAETTIKWLTHHARIITALKLTAAELDSLLSNPANFGVTVSTPLNFGQIQTLVNYRRWTGQFHDTDHKLVDYIEGLKGDDSDNLRKTAAKNLAALFTKPSSEIETLIDGLWPTKVASGVRPPYGTIPNVLKIADALHLAERTRLSTTGLKDLAGLATKTAYPDFTDTARVMVNAIRADTTHSDTRKATVKALNERTRDALIAHVYPVLKARNIPVDSLNDLYEYLLIDVSVSGDFMTSRVKEAIGAYQLYADRCLMQLERNTTVMDSFKEYWKTLEHFRLWQANRKLFLYPENYIEPELRKNTSDLFKTLEQGLRAANLTEKTIDKVFRKYLDQFKAVANLRIVGSYAHKRNNPADSSNPHLTLYLVGKHAGSETDVYIRSVELEYDSALSGYTVFNWGFWSKVDQSIVSEEIQPGYHGGILYLFWVNIQVEGKQKTGEASANSKTPRFHSGHLNFSRKNTDGSWSTPTAINKSPSLFSSSFKTAEEILKRGGTRIEVVSENGTLYVTSAILAARISKNGLISHFACQYAPTDGFLSTNARGIQAAIGTKISSAIVCTAAIPDVDDFSIYFRILGVAGQSDHAVHIRNPKNSGVSIEVTPRTSDLYIRGVPGTSEDLSSLGKGAWNYLELKVYNPRKGRQGSIAHYINGAARGNVALNGRLDPTNLQFLSSQNTYIDDVIVLEGVDHKLNLLDLSYDVPNRDFTTISDGTQRRVNNFDSIAILGNKEGEYLVIPHGSKRQYIRLNTTGLTALEEDMRLNGAKGVLTLPAQNSKEQSFTALQPRTGNVAKPYPSETLDFDGANGGYLWELFFHAPWLVASTFNKQQKFNLAQTWYQYLFDPTTKDTDDKRYWRFKPLRDPNPATTAVFLPPLEGKLWLLKPFSSMSEALSRATGSPTATYKIKKVDFGVEGSIDPEGEGTVSSFLKDSVTDLSGSGSSEHKFAVHRISGLIYLEAGDHPIVIRHDDGYRLKINNVLIGEDTRLTSVLVANKTYTAARSGFYKVDIEYFEHRLTAEFSIKIDGKYLGLDRTVPTVSDILINPDQLHLYETDPFDPHAIARLRPAAYQKALVRHYIDNLIAFGDRLFREDTRETLVEATQIYVRALDLLGDRPRARGKLALPAEDNLGDVGDETYAGTLHDDLLAAELRLFSGQAANARTPSDLIADPYFGIPENDNLLKVWDRVEGRLYNLRHNLDINGKVQNLPLFQPPIDPAQAVALAASGQPVASLATGGDAVITPYRFRTILEKAKEAVRHTSELGSTLLSILEQKDADALENLRQTHESAILKKSVAFHTSQIKAASQQIAVLKRNKLTAQDRFQHFDTLIKGGLSKSEASALSQANLAPILMIAGSAIKGASAVGYALPSIFGLADGGMKFGDVINAAAEALVSTSQIEQMKSQASGMSATYERRLEDWIFQRQQALLEGGDPTKKKESESSLSQQIAAAQYQLDVEEKQLKLLKTQIANSAAIDTFVKNRFSNSQLYQWLVGRLTSLYFQSYQQAHILAVMAQQSWQFERNHTTTFLRPSYWNNLHQGLLAAEGLTHDLLEMDRAYLVDDRRDMEIVKIVSLKDHIGDSAFNTGKTSGKFSFILNELDYDKDYPGHYLRKVKAVSVTVPAVLGPYQQLKATLVQTENKLLVEPNLASVKTLIKNQDANPNGIKNGLRNDPPIALSGGVNDSGLFQMTYADERYLPFEGSGALSKWILEIHPDENGNLLSNLTDILFEIRYTARDGGQQFRHGVRIAKAAAIAGS